MIHNGDDNKYRLPIFLPLEMSKEWLGEELTPQRYKEILEFSIPSGELDYHTVYTIRGKTPRADNKLKNETCEWENLPALGEMNP